MTVKVTRRKEKNKRVDFNTFYLIIKIQQRVRYYKIKTHKYIVCHIVY